MLGEERQSRIVDLVVKNNSMTIQRLMEELGASESTIRRDLSELNEKGLIQKVYGGAIARNVVFDNRDISVNTRKEFNHDDKAQIARYAASLITDDDFVYLDAGTTTELMIDYITATKAMFVTNAFVHAKKLGERGFMTYILGGQIKMPTEAVVGEEALLALHKYHFTKGFWGTNAVSYGSGYSTPDTAEAMVKHMSMKHTAEKYVVADSSKFSQISCVSFAEFTDCTVITCNLDGSNVCYNEYRNVIDVNNVGGGEQ